MEAPFANRCPLPPSPDWTNTPKTVVFHYARRSAHRLRMAHLASKREESAVPTGAPFSTEELSGGRMRVNYRGVWHCGANLAIDDWVLTTKSDGVPVVARLTSVFAEQDETGDDPTFSVDAQAWPTSILFRDPLGMVVAARSAFATEGTPATFPLSLALKPLFVVHIEGEDLTTFTERP